MEWIHLFVYSVKVYRALLSSVHNAGDIAVYKCYYGTYSLGGSGGRKRHAGHYNTTRENHGCSETLRRWVPNSGNEVRLSRDGDN